MRTSTTIKRRTILVTTRTTTNVIVFPPHLCQCPQRRFSIGDFSILRSVEATVKTVKTVNCSLRSKCIPGEMWNAPCVVRCACWRHCATVHCAPVGATVANGASDSSASSVHTVPWSRKGLAHFSFKICFFYFFNHTSKLKPLWMTGIGIIFALLTFDFHVSDKNRFLFSVDGVAGKMREGCWWPKSWTLRQVRTDFVFVGAPTKKIILSCVAIFRLSWVTVFRFGAKY